MTKPSHIHPVFKDIVQREEKEAILNQRAKALWLTGLSGSGKSTVAIAVEQVLHGMGYLTQILDGDNIRSGINNNLGFSMEDRLENIRRIAEVSKLFLNCGIITLNSFVSPTFAIRDQARQIIGANDFLEIYINAPLDVCEKRDVKELYKKARSGEIKNFTGINAPFEAPEKPFLEIHTDRQSVEESVNTIINNILPLIKKTNS